jgi:hypothetical protein
MEQFGFGRLIRKGFKKKGQAGNIIKISQQVILVDNRIWLSEEGYMMAAVEE